MLFLFSPKIASAQEDPDWHFWTSQAVEAQVSRDISITMGQEYHVANDMSRLNFHWTDFNVAYAFTDWFEASISYRQVSHLLGQENRWIQEYRQCAESIAGHKPCEFKANGIDAIILI